MLLCLSVWNISTLYLIGWNRASRMWRTCLKNSSSSRPLGKESVRRTTSMNLWSFIVTNSFKIDLRQYRSRGLFIVMVIIPTASFLLRQVWGTIDKMLNQLKRYNSSKNFGKFRWPFDGHSYWCRNQSGVTGRLLSAWVDPACLAEWLHKQQG